MITPSLGTDHDVDAASSSKGQNSGPMRKRHGYTGRLVGFLGDGSNAPPSISRTYSTASTERETRWYGERS